MQKNSATIILLLVLVFPLGMYGRDSGDPELAGLAEEIQAGLDALQKEGNFPGATLALVLRDGTEFTFATGWADIENRVPMKPDDRMFTGSAGKTFVAAVAIQLIQEGKLSLDKKIRDYLGSEPWFSHLPNHADLTLRMIMTHTGGLPRYVFDEAFIDQLLESPDKVWTPEELLAFVLDKPPVHPAGEGWAYSDTDYIVLGMIIESICGEDFYSVLDKRILTPFALKSTSPSNKRRLKGLVNGYTGDRTPPFRLPGKVPVDGVYPINPQFEWCGGGLITNSLDMARWAKILYEGKVFSDVMLKEMLQPMDFRTGEPSDQGYGLGVMIFKQPFGLSYGHGGIFPGYETQMSYFPKWETAVAMQVNADSFSGKLKSNLNRCIARFVPVLEEYYRER